MATEVIHTIKTSGGDYSLLSSWEFAQQRDLVTADEIAVAECYSGEFTDNVAIAGWTTDNTRYVQIRAASGHAHGGVASAGFRVTSGDNGVIRPANHVRIKGIVILPTSNQIGVNVQPASDFTRIERCVISGGGTSTGAGITIYNSVTVRLFNTIIYGFKGGSGGYGVRANDASATVHCYNNTVVDCRFGIIRSNGTLRAKNNIAQNCSNSDFSGTLTDTEGNISSDTSSPQTGLRSIDLTFANHAGADFHLTSGDTQAQGAGADLSADPNLAFSDDIDGDARPAGDWDIGADQSVASPAGGVPSGLGLLGVGV